MYCTGGLFHPGDDNQVLAFRYAVDIINQDNSMLPRSKLSAQVETISPYDSFHASKKGPHSLYIYETPPGIRNHNHMLYSINPQNMCICSV